ncbi:hypothetical protein F5X98DRAFT_379107 [Xylaria grammica]|nr:hypothetical protein F5X98DRAFT_379107 [Xylaria grammica]
MTLATAGEIPSSHHVKPKGFGVDVWAIDQDNISPISTYICAVACVFVRLSILLFYIRIFCIPRARALILSTVVVLVAEGIAFFPPTLFQCTPISYFWLRWDGEHHGHCVKIRPLVWVSAAVGILLDVWLIVLPLLFIAGLQLRKKKKVLLASMFAMGIVHIHHIRSVIAISLARLPYIDKEPLV